jgi:F0F1-type ATP synthase delta subunit
MVGFSRRRLAQYAVDQLLAGASADKISKHLAAALKANKKTKEADLLMADISQDLEARGLLAQATVTTATPLPNSLREKLIAQIEKAAGVKEVELAEQIDKKVLGGFRIETANHAWDKTVSRKLHDIKGGING